MIKFEGISGLKLDWLISELKKETKATDAIVKRAFVEVVFDDTNYSALLDRVADYISEHYDCCFDNSETV